MTGQIIKSGRGIIFIPDQPEANTISLILSYLEEEKALARENMKRASENQAVHLHIKHNAEGYLIDRIEGFIKSLQKPA